MVGLYLRQSCQCYTIRVFFTSNIYVLFNLNVFYVLSSRLQSGNVLSQCGGGEHTPRPASCKSLWIELKNHIVAKMCIQPCCIKASNVIICAKYLFIVYSHSNNSKHISKSHYLIQSLTGSLSCLLCLIVQCSCDASLCEALLPWLPFLPVLLYTFLSLTLINQSGLSCGLMNVKSAVNLVIFDLDGCWSCYPAWLI